MAKLTNSYIDKLLPPSSGYALHWDTQDRGFGLRLTSQGKRTFVVQGRVHGKELRLTIGPHGVFTPDQARTAAREFLRTMRLGTDPREVRREAVASSVTLRQVADGYLRDRPLKPRSKAEVERHVTTTLAPWLQKPLTSISRELVTTRFNQLKSHGLRGTGPAPAQANQAFSVLRALFNYAIREHRKPDGSAVLTDNPVDVLYKKWTPLRPRTRRIPDSKVGAVWVALHEAEGEGVKEQSASIDLVRFLLLTGARIGEAAPLTWDRVNLEEGWWHIPDPKNSNPVWLPLPTQAVEMLAKRKEAAASNFVFPSWGKKGHVRIPRETMRRISDVAGETLSPHDMRRSFTTIAVAACGVELNKVELLTNHVPKGVTARHYLETSRLIYLRPEIQRVADWIEVQSGVEKSARDGHNIFLLRA